MKKFCIFLLIICSSFMLGSCNFTKNLLLPDWIRSQPVLENVKIIDANTIDIYFTGKISDDADFFEHVSIYGSAGKLKIKSIVYFGIHKQCFRCYLTADLQENDMITVQCHDDWHGFADIIYLKEEK